MTFKWKSRLQCQHIHERKYLCFRWIVLTKSNDRSYFPHLYLYSKPHCKAWHKFKNYGLTFSSLLISLILWGKSGGMSGSAEPMVCGCGWVEFKRSYCLIDRLLFIFYILRHSGGHRRIWIVKKRTIIYSRKVQKLRTFETYSAGLWQIHWDELGLLYLL